MKSFFSTKYSNGAFNFGMLLLRVFLGLILISHGYPKLVNFSTLQHKFMNFMNMGSTVSLALITFAELFCGFLLLIGMFTRLAAIPVAIGMGVVFFVASHADLFGNGERGGMYFAASILLLLCGPGKISVDGMMGK